MWVEQSPPSLLPRDMIARSLTTFRMPRREMVPAGVEFIEGDLSDCALLEEVFRSAKGEGRPFDAVLHFAALIEAGESMVRPEIFTFGTIRLPRWRCSRR